METVPKLRKKRLRIHYIEPIPKDWNEHAFLWNIDEFIDAHDNLLTGQDRIATMPQLKIFPTNCLITNSLSSEQIVMGINKFINVS